MTPSTLFTRCATALFGPEFVAPLANALGIDKNTVGKFRDGKSRVPPGVWRDVAVLMQDREIELAVLKVDAIGLADRSNT